MKGTCSVETCDRPQHTRGLCLAHYHRLYYGGDIRPDEPIRAHRANGPCSVAGCEREVDARDLCRLHYVRWQRTGSVNLPTTEERFLAKVEKTERCWFWNGHRNANGYGVMNVGGKSTLAHRWSYERWIGKIGEGLTIDHLCRVRHCVNPAHLEAVTMRVNVHRSPFIPAAQQARRVACFRGHLFDETRNARGRRVCVVCDRERSRRRHARAGADSGAGRPGSRLRDADRHGPAEGTA